MKRTNELLAAYAALMNRHGSDSPEAIAFVEAHAENEDFLDLAETARCLKKAFIEQGPDQASALG